jgi:hypothetical protein
MTLTLSQLDHDDLCHGWSWVVQDEEKLARQVARVALGQFRHVSRILAGVEPDDPATTHDHAADAIELLTVPDAAVIIFEDKATENPRKTIREDVWPGIAALESGKRVNQLTHDVSAALETQKYF